MSERTNMVKLTGIVGLMLGCGTLAVGCGSGGHDARPTFAATAGGPRMVAAGLQTSRSGHTATKLDGQRVLVTGGQTLQLAATNTAEVFDAKTGFSTPLPETLTTPRTGHFAAPISSNLTLIGGGQDDRQVPLSSLEVFDATLGTFTARSETLRKPRVGAAVLIQGDTLFLACGQNQSSLEAWSLSTMKPTLQIDDLPGGPRVGAQLVAFDQDTLLLYGGDADQPPVWIELSSRATVARNDVFFGGTAVRAPGINSTGVLIVGGFAGAKPSRLTQVITPDDTEQDEANMIDAVALIVPREKPVVVDTGKQLLVFAGHFEGTPKAESERHSLIVREPLPDMHGSRSDPVAVLLDDGLVALVGGMGADGRPSALIDVFVPAGVRGPDSAQTFDDAEQALADSRQLDENLLSTDRDRKTAQAEVKRLEGELAKAKAELAQERATAASLQGRITQTRDQIAQLRAREQTLQGQVQQEQAKVAALQQDLTASQQDRQAAESALAQTEAQLAAVRRSLASSQDDINRLQGQLNTANGQIGSLTRTRDQLQQELSRL